MAKKNFEPWREVLRKFVDEHQHTDEISMTLNELFRQLNSDNAFNLGIPYKLNLAVEEILKLAIGQVKFDWLMWWMYDSISIMSGKRHAIVGDATGNNDVELLNFDEFFDFAFKNESVEQIIKNRK